MTSYPRMMGGPLGAAQPMWRMEGSHVGTADEAKVRHILDSRC